MVGESWDVVSSGSIWTRQPGVGRSPASVSPGVVHAWCIRGPGSVALLASVLQVRGLLSVGVEHAILPLSIPLPLVHTCYCARPSKWISQSGDQMLTLRHSHSPGGRVDLSGGGDPADTSRRCLLPPAGLTRTA